MSYRQRRAIALELLQGAIEIPLHDLPVADGSFDERLRFVIGDEVEAEMGDEVAKREGQQGILQDPLFAMAGHVARQRRVGRLFHASVCGWKTAKLRGDDRSEME